MVWFVFQSAQEIGEELGALSHDGLQFRGNLSSQGEKNIRVLAENLSEAQGGLFSGGACFPFSIRLRYE